jgi:hypothetical protein
MTVENHPALDYLRLSVTNQPPKGGWFSKRSTHKQALNPALSRA